MLNKVLVVPDVHGRKFWIEAMNLVELVDKVIFLGDYLDPYPHEGISFDEAVQEFKCIIEFKKAFPDKVVLLLGNHDMHYVDMDFMDCSRLNYKRRQELNNLYTENKDLFQLMYTYEGFLFSHAGVMQTWLDEYCHCSLEEFLIKPIDEVYQELEVVSYLRGGWESCGSCIWNDLREFSNTLDYFQIFGHTQLQENPYVKDNFACLDCRDCFILDTITKEIKRHE